MALDRQTFVAQRIKFHSGPGWLIVSQKEGWMGEK